MRIASIAFSLLVLAGSCGDASGEGSAPSNAASADASSYGPPVQTSPPNGRGQTPAFPGQTRAPSAKTATPLDVQTVATELDGPWALAFLPDGRMLVTEKSGQLLLLSEDGRSRTPVEGLPPVDSRGQGGLLDVALSPDYATSRQVYWCYSEPAGGANATAAARGRLILDGRPRVERVEVLFSQKPKLDSVLHFGCRFAFPGDGTFFLTTGERSILEGRRQAQRLDGHLGKVIRLNLDGSVPSDNPFVGGGGLPEIWSYGHRNLQSAVMGPGGKLWTVEHGPRGGDELNQPQAGKNYGWPAATYGIEYAGGPIGAGLTRQAGMEQPVYYWDPVIAPSGMAYYTADLVPEWKGDLFIGGLQATAVVRLVMDGDRVAAEEWLLRQLGKRIRDVRQGPDGALWLLTDDGDLLRVTPK